MGGIEFIGFSRMVDGGERFIFNREWEDGYKKLTILKVRKDYADIVSGETIWSDANRELSFKV